MTCARGCCPTPRDHFRSLQVQRPVAAARRRRDFALEADRSAYRDLRQQGYAPPRIDGSYDLTRRALNDAEINGGLIITDPDPTKRRQGAAMMRDTVEIATKGMTGKAPEWKAQGG